MQVKARKLTLEITMLAICVFMLPAVMPHSFSGAYAQEASEPQEFDTLERKEQIELLNKQMRSLAADILSDLGPNEMQHIYNIRTNHGIIQSVLNTRNDLAKAVKSCLQKHNDIQSLEVEFAAWKQRVDPVVKKAQSSLQEAIETQKIVSPQKLKLYLLTLDKMVEIKESSKEKKYIDDKKACLELGQKMGKTSKELITLLKQTLKNI